MTWKCHSTPIWPQKELPSPTRSRDTFQIVDTTGKYSRNVFFLRRWCVLGFSFLFHRIQTFYNSMHAANILFNYFAGSEYCSIGDNVMGEKLLEYSCTCIWLPSILPLRWEPSRTSCVGHLGHSVPIPSSGVWGGLVKVWGLSQVRLQFPQCFIAE